MANLAQIFDWFMTGKKPTQAQFWASWGSFWNKEETIPQSAISNLASTLSAKTENDQFNAHKVAEDAHADLFTGKEDKFQKGAANGYLGLDVFSKPIGLENVDNTADVDKEVSTPQQQALEKKVDKVAGERLINAAEIEKLETGIYTKTEIDAKVSSVYKFMGNVPNYASLPNTELVIGHVYNLIDTGANYAWTGSVWDEIGTTIDISGKVDKNSPIAAGTYTKLTYDAKGLVTGGTNATKSDVGLGNVDNTTDLLKPISTATQTVLNLKANNSDVLQLIGGTLIGGLFGKTAHFSQASASDTLYGYNSFAGGIGVTGGAANGVGGYFVNNSTIFPVLKLLGLSGTNLIEGLSTQGVIKFSVTSSGNVLANSFVNSSAPAKNILLADGNTSLVASVVNSLDYTFFTQVYGVQRDLTIAAPEWTRIGNMELHASLPVHSLIRRCLVTDAGVVTYLNSENSALKADGSAADLTGAAGQVMVEIPEHYRRFSQDGNVQTVLYSLSPFTGAEKMPKKYTSAFKATVERATSKLASVVNTTAAFRGGNNNATLDAAVNTQLGKPASSISRTSFETFGANRGVNWTNMDYQVRKDIYWLIVAEYATTNHQAAFNAVKTAAGYRQGGLGDGPTNINGGDWSAFNDNNPLFNCGTTLALGNNTGVNAITLNDFPTTGLSKATQTISYRGLENIFGDIWEWTSGINIKTNSGSAVVFVKNNKALNSSVDYFSYRPVGSMPINNGYISKIIFGAEGDIMPKEANGSATTYFSDYYYQSNPAVETLRGVLFGGTAYNGSYAGSACSGSGSVPSLTHASVGSRLCFLP